ncbi:hypothetical protein H5410_034085 [Solanum commersonii]|uniref:Uncharacterized protein n=1 Tax=Solanum commersonii TaxID=4109 RepID=A0A9J5YPN9_SOLCO|nr:hypothetical protein H5410_034085 [Solanum commersonii]
MTERQFSLNKVMVSFTYRDYIQHLIKFSRYNNERHKHTWFIKVRTRYLRILYQIGFKLVVIPRANNKNIARTISQVIQRMGQEFSVPWIHKWVPEVDFTEEQIPCLYRTYYNNFWDKLMKKDPQTKSIYGQELLDLITKTVHDYKTIPNKGIMTDDSTSVKHMARKISNHDEGEQNEMIMRYLEEVKKKILLNISHYAKSDSSMRSETSEDMHEAQQYEEESPVDALKKAEDFLAKLKDKV